MTTPRDWLNIPSLHGAAAYPEPVRIEHAFTEGDEIGPMPPHDAGVWHAVRSSADGRTLWRRIRLGT